MSDYLAAEPATDADAVFRNFMRHNLDLAAATFDVIVVGEPVFGWRLRSISAPVRSSAGDRWLRVVSQEPQWARGDSWTGTEDANAITGIPKPYVLDIDEWPERDWRHQRAELLTLLDGQPCSTTDVLRTDSDVATAWWSALASSLDMLASTPTERVHADQGKVTERITQRFGLDAPTHVGRWETVHGDLHWANLLRRPFGLLDWELWGQGPAGLDAATLYCFSLLTPDTSEQIRCRFANKLDTATGRVAGLYAIARLLRRIDGGDFPDLAAPLRRHADDLLAR